jgi:hypothetical protein
MAITAIPLSAIQASDVSSAANNPTPTIGKSSFRPSLIGAVTIGRMPLDLSTQVFTNRSTYFVPVRRLSGKAKDDEGDSVAGRLHTVTATCEVDERGGEIWAHKLALERTPHHLVLTFRDGTLGFAVANEDTYTCTIERDGAKVNLQFRLQNLMGIQMIV